MSRTIKNTEFQNQINEYIRIHSNCIGFAFFQEQCYNYGEFEYKNYISVRPNYDHGFYHADILSCCIKNMSLYRSRIFSAYGNSHPDYMARFAKFVSSMDGIKIFYVMVGSQNIEINKEKFIESIHLNAISMLSYSGKEM